MTAYSKEGEKKYVNEAIRLDPDFTAAYRKRAQAYEKMAGIHRDWKRYDLVREADARVRADYIEILRLNPNDAEAKIKTRPVLTLDMDKVVEAWLRGDLPSSSSSSSGGGSSSSSGSTTFRAQYHVQGSFTATVNGKINSFTISEFVTATSQADARQQVESAIRRQHPTANNINITRIQGP